MKPVVANELERSYGSKEALKGVSFDVDAGEIFGIIGPDGAGKTTLFRILTTLLLADKGHATVMGYEVRKQYREIRKCVGYMPGRFSLYQDLTVEENLNTFAALFRTTVKENYHLIEDIYKQIAPFKKRKAGALSGGMKQKLALSCALIHKPDVLFLDEPTTGVDPVSRNEFWDMLYKLKSQGITIIVSTPYMDEASRCDRIALILEGSFLQIASPDSIVHDFRKELFAIRSSDMSGLLKDLRGFDRIRSCYAFGDTHHVTFSDQQQVDEVEQYLLTRGHADIEIQSIIPGIEDCFMELAS